MQFFTGVLHKIRGPCLLLGVSFRKPGRRGEFHLEIGDLEFLNLSRSVALVLGPVAKSTCGRVPDSPC